MINIGVRFFVTDSRMALYGVVGIWFFLSIFSKTILRNLLKVR
jgi:hypothetical protein